jgi:hypothetical protein
MKSSGVAMTKTIVTEGALPAGMEARSGKPRSGFQ